MRCTTSAQFRRIALAAFGLIACLGGATAFEYLGCYRDVFSAGERDLVGSLLLNENSANLVTPDYCEDYCGQRQFTFVGVQFGSECWCGNTYGRHGKLADTECSTACVGDAKLVNRCGGALANSVYRITKTYAKPAAHPNDGRPLIGLVMIVKDEAHTLPNTLKTLAPFLDTYHVLDTGSTDGTQDAIKKVLGPKGEVWEEPFIDYGRSRNRALDIAQKSKNAPIFSLMLSADETVHNPSALRAFCELHRNAEGAMHEAYPIQMDVGWKFDSMRLSRTDKGWRYVGRVHEYLAAPDQRWRPSLRVPDAWIQFHVTDPERRGKREFKIKDILLEETREKPQDTRAAFYLARTWNVIGNHSAALIEFRRRIALGGWQEEVYESYYAIAFQLEALGRPWIEVQQAFLDAHNHSPERGEPLHNIAQHYYNSISHKALAYPYAALCATLPYPKDAVLWVQADVYNHQCLALQGLSGLLTKVNLVAGFTALLKALKSRPTDYAMLAAKTKYENMLRPIDRTKAECEAGVKKGPECTNTPCASVADGAPPQSLQSRMASQTSVAEQSNLLVQSGSSLNDQHIPSTLRERYTSIEGPGLADYGSLALVLILLLVCSIIGGLVCASRYCSRACARGPCSGIWRKIVGGKRISARAGLSSIKHAVEEEEEDLDGEKFV